MRTLQTLGVASVLALVAATCKSDTTTTPNTSTNATRTLLTDSPFPYDRIARVDIYVVSVSASLTADTGSANGFVTLATPNRRINVLALQNGATDELGAVTLPAGAITSLRMVIDTDSSSITLKSGAKLTGTSTPGIQWQSSAGRPVLNALVQEQIQVPIAGAIVAIDFDIGKAFIPPQEIDPTSTDSGFVFSPVIRAADAARTGTVSGVVRSGSTTGSPVPSASLRLYLGRQTDPENTWITLATATTDATGAFRFSYVTRSDYWAGIAAHAGKSYIVAVDPPSGAGLTRILVPNLVVTAGSETAAGIVVLR
jgi:hypothetical protein